MTDLPTVEQLQRLPLRAIAAYAARAAQRARPVLRGVIDDSVVEDILSIVEVVSTAAIDGLNSPSALLAGARLLDVSAPIEKPGDQLLAVMCLVRTAVTAYAVLEGATHPGRASRYAAYAAGQAEGAADNLASLGEPLGEAAANAMRLDYEVLLKSLGQHDTVIIGDPIDLSEGSFLGPLGAALKP